MPRITKPSAFDPLASGVAIAAALRTGILHELTKGPTTEQALVDLLKLDLRATRLVIGVLECHELIERDGDRVEAGAALLALGDTPGGYAIALGIWARVEEFVRTGEPVIAMDQSAAEREQAYRGIVSSLGDSFEALAGRLADALGTAAEGDTAAIDAAAEGAPRPRTILDVGCGSGVWSLAIAQRHPAAIVTGQDLPAVLDSFTARAAALSLTARTRTLPGDMYTVDLPAGAFDLVVIANVLRLETPERGAAIVARLATAVAPGGSLLVVDALAGGSPEAERERAHYALHLGLRTRSGEVHSPETITRWCTRAGLPAVTPVQLADAGSVGALLATRG